MSKLFNQMTMPKNTRIKMTFSARFLAFWRSGSIIKPIPNASVTPMVVARNSPRMNLISLPYPIPTLNTRVYKKIKDRETSPLEEREEKEKSPLWKKENIGTPSRRKGAINVIEKPFHENVSISTPSLLKRFLHKDRFSWLDFSNILSIANP